MKKFWLICLGLELIAIILVLATGLVARLIGKCLLAFFAAMAVSSLMKMFVKREDERSDEGREM